MTIAKGPARCPRRTKWRLARRAGLVAVLLVMAGVSVAACGGGSDPSASGGTSGQSPSNQSSSANSGAIAFASCMRANGVPNFPDSAISTANGGVELNVPSGIDTKSSQFQAAMQTCRKDLPRGGSSGSGSSSGSSAQQIIKFANCMRANGVPNFPEPNAQGQEVITGGSGLNPSSPQFQSAYATCQHLLPAGAVGG